MTWGEDVVPADGPSWADVARDALVKARVASLVLREDGPDRSVTMVAITDQADGCPVVWLAPTSLAVRRLTASSVGSLSVSAPTPFWSLRLAGVLEPHPSDRIGLRAFRMTPHTIALVGAARVAVPLRRFLAPDPAGCSDPASALVRHLETTHAAELLAAARSHRRDAVAVVPRTVDRHGIELAVLSPDGVATLRLPHPPADGHGSRSAVACPFREHG